VSHSPERVEQARVGAYSSSSPQTPAVLPASEYSRQPAAVAEPLSSHCHRRTPAISVISQANSTQTTPGKVLAGDGVKAHASAFWLLLEQSNEFETTVLSAQTLFFA